MAFPTHRIDYEVLGGRVHATVSNYSGEPLLCAIGNLAWPFTATDGAWASLALVPADQCDHGGTHRHPERWGLTKVREEMRAKGDHGMCRAGRPCFLDDPHPQEGGRASHHHTEGDLNYEP